MDQLESLGLVVLDDDMVKLRTNTGLIKLSELSGGLEQPQVEALIQAAINALVGGAPATLDTLKELADSLNSDDDVFTTLNTLINQKQATITIPTIGANQVSLLSGNTLKNLEFSGTVSVTDTGNSYLISIPAVSSSTFATYHTLIMFNISQKQDELTSGGGSGQEVLTGTTIRRINASGPVTLSADSTEVLISIDGYTQGQITGFLSNKQDSLSTAASGSGTDLLNSNTVRKITVTSRLTISEANDVITLGSDAQDAGDVAGALSFALSSYSTTAAMNTTLALKQNMLTSTLGMGIRSFAIAGPLMTSADSDELVLTCDCWSKTQTNN